jgi:hypothetical protein
VRSAVSTLTPVVRRRAANAVLGTAAALARMADEIEDLERRGGALDPDERVRLRDLEAASLAARTQYQAAISRFRAVTGAA